MSGILDSYFDQDYHGPHDESVKARLPQLTSDRLDRLDRLDRVVAYITDNGGHGATRASLIRDAIDRLLDEIEAEIGPALRAVDNG